MYAAGAAAIVVRNFTSLNRVNDIPWADDIRELDAELRLSWTEEENSNFVDDESTR